MSLPGAQEIRRPLLEAFKGETPSNFSINETLEIIAEYYGLNLNDFSSGEKNILRSIINEAKADLKKNKLLYNPSGNIYMITNAGRKILEDGPEIISDEYLRERRKKPLPLSETLGTEILPDHKADDNKPSQENETLTENETMPENNNAQEADIALDDETFTDNDTSQENETLTDNETMPENDNAQEADIALDDETFTDNDTSQENETLTENETMPENDNAQEADIALDDETFTDNDTSQENETLTDNETMPENDNAQETDIALDETFTDNDTSQENETLTDNETMPENDNAQEADIALDDETFTDNDTSQENETLTDNETMPENDNAQEADIALDETFTDNGTSEEIDEAPDEILDTEEVQTETMPEDIMIPDETQEDITPEPEAIDEAAAESQPEEEYDPEILAAAIPSNSIDDAIARHNSELADELLMKAAGLPSDRFEMLVIDLLSKMGYFAFQTARYTTETAGSDLIHGVILDNQSGANIYIQARKLSPGRTVGKADIQDFVNELSDKGGKGIFATTANFSENAKVLAADERLMLIDGEKLANLMIANNFCVNVEKVYEIKAVDPEAFSEYE